MMDSQLQLSKYSDWQRLQVRSSTARGQISSKGELGGDGVLALQLGIDRTSIRTEFAGLKASDDLGLMEGRKQQHSACTISIFFLESRCETVRLGALLIAPGRRKKVKKH